MVVSSSSLSLVLVLVSACVCAWMVRPVAAWWDTGHTLVAEIARQNLSPATQAAINGYLSVDANTYPDLSTLPYVAVWPDYAKSDLHAFDQFHYVDFPYCPLHWSNATLPGGDNILTILPTLLDSLNQRTRANDLPWQRLNAQWTHNFAIRMITHLIGDLHQPLHAIQLWSPDFPSGDVGGNLFVINYTSPLDGQNYGNLHSLYDSVAGLWAGYMPLPMTQTWADFITNTASQLQATYPLSSFPALTRESARAPFNFSGWASESFALAISSGYSQLTPGPQNTIGQPYIDSLQALLKQRIVMAGYRLARVLNASVWDNTPQPAPTPAEPTDDSTRALSAREVGLVVLLLIAVVSVPIAYETGYRRGVSVSRSMNEAVGLLSTADKSAAAAGSLPAAAGSAGGNVPRYDTRPVASTGTVASDVTLEVSESTIVHSGIESERAAEKRRAAAAAAARRS